MGIYLLDLSDWYDNEHVPLRLNHLPSFSQEQGSVRQMESSLAG